jgi:hypothetical protein
MSSWLREQSTVRYLGNFFAPGGEIFDFLEKGEKKGRIFFDSSTCTVLYYEYRTMPSKCVQLKS